MIQTLYINLKEEKKINGIQPKKLGRADPNYPKSQLYNRNWFNFHYPELMLKLDFTGIILLSSEFIDSRYVHMGFQSPESYEKNIQLKFENGKFVSEVDKSLAIEKHRQENFSDTTMGPPNQSEKAVKNWIADSFSLDYKDDSKNKEN